MSPAAVVDPRQPWRLLIKGMGGLQTGAVGEPGKTQLTINGTTRIWSRETTGVIREWQHLTIDASYGTVWVNPIVVPPNPAHDELTGGSFYMLKEGPYAGYLVSFWSNDITDPNNDDLPWGDIEVGHATTTEFDRGPGAVLATLGPGDVTVSPGPGSSPVPHLVGASKNYNAAGEMHFTLLVDSPYIGIPLPKKTHYAIEFYRGGQWVEVFAGLIWDMDATDTEVVFYGIDYLGLLNYIVDERYDPSGEQKESPEGSKFTGKPIHTIIQSMLNYAIDAEDSILGFMTVDYVQVPFSPNISKVYSTLSPVLQFIVGLIESSRAGSGKSTRISVVKNEAGKYVFRVQANPGSRREDLKLAYVPGGLIQGYRVIPFGKTWASRVNFVGRNVKGLKTYFHNEASAVDQGEWGRIAQGATFVDGTEDENDIKRRAMQAAVDASRMGRQISVGLRLGSFSPEENYEVCDSLPVQIKHGAVDTYSWGSDTFGCEDVSRPEDVQAAYWQILGLTWESFDDSHWMTNLTLFPKGVVPDDGCG